MTSPSPTGSPADVPVCETVSLVRRFGRRRAVAGVDLRIHAGECLALFGPNGAGKTTLLRLLAGLLRPTSGEVRLLGRTLTSHSAVERGRVGLISHQSMLYDVLTVAENVAFAARLHGVRDVAGATTMALDRLGLRGRELTPVRALSRGWQQRVSIARAIVHDPALVLLDEPYTGLDVSGARALTELLRSLRDGGAALALVTHSVEEGLTLATHAAIVLDGQIRRRDLTAGLDPVLYAASYRDLALESAA
ncbi:MAG: heme ABC exporter ATP-binding protein CcmA [Gemmatimonadaceae bacterium]|nr:heme ABC exporter ATP-binding protein CcmA [Gemmatimonadaceae bacterium]